MNTEVIEGELMDEQVEKHGALAVRHEAPPPSLFNTDEPVEVIAKATKVADALKAVVVSKKLVANIKGKEYPLVEAWITLAAMLNVNAVTEWTRKTENGWEARVVVRNNAGLDIAAAESQCTRDERDWKNRDDYALRSMAQTRATSKALRSKLGFIMTLAGYQATPAEEMPSVENVSQTRVPSGESTSRGDEGDAIAANLERAKEAFRKHLFATYPVLSDDDRRHAYIQRVYAKSSIKDLNMEQLRDLEARLQKQHA